MKRTIKIIINIAVFVMVAFAWGRMFRGEDGALTSRGFVSLKYFTVLSNLLAGIASLVYVAALLRGKVGRFVYLLKYAGVTSVGLTFIVVMAFLGPTMGYRLMFVGSSLYMHLIVPLLAAGEFIFLDHEHEVRMRDTLCAVIPMVLYGIFYVGNILINGVGEGFTSNDWYGFTMFGVDKIWLVYLIVTLVTWGIACGLRAGNRAALKAVN
ncbi:MAG: hypothetical protein IJ744_10290 [Lachnospiraceae bacterium]|nr:hypothetical protein [Lachnospiraceae bacterium]